jgi:hypothetical protein
LAANHQEQWYRSVKVQTQQPRAVSARGSGSGRPRPLGRPVGRCEWWRRSPLAAAVAVRPQARCLPEGPVVVGSGSGRKAVAPLGAARRQDRTAGAGAHAQPEAVGLRAPAVVRLEGALAHVGAPSSWLGVGPALAGDATRPQDVDRCLEFTRERSSNRNRVRAALQTVNDQRPACRGYPAEHMNPQVRAEIHRLVVDNG